MVSREHGALKHKDHAQDCETLIATNDQHPAILPWSLYFGWHPSSRYSGHLALPSGRIAAGRLLDMIFFMSLRMIVSENPESGFTGRPCESARNKRAYSSDISDECCAFRA